MQLGIFAKTFPRPTLEETLDAVVANGLTQIQFNMACIGVATLPDRLDESSCIWIAREIKDRGLTMAAISGTFNLGDPDTAELKRNLHRLDLLAAACRWLDTRIITLCTGTRNPVDMWRWHPENVRKQTWESLVAAVKEACKIADRNEVTLAFEPEVNNIVNSVSKARRLLDEVGSPWLKVAIDPANLPIPHCELLRSIDQVFQERAGYRESDKDRLASILVPDPIVNGYMKEVFEEAFDWLGPDIVLAHAKEPRLETVSPNLMKLLKKGEAQTLRQGVFYGPYFDGLRSVGYSGAIIIHGLEETDVSERVSLLRGILETIPGEV
jgi:sugar phosphate isomerase/epimerase